MLSKLVFTFFAAIAVVATSPDNEVVNCSILPEKIMSRGNFTHDDANNLNQILADAGCNIGVSSESPRYTRDAGLSVDLDSFQMEYDALGREEMIRQGKLILVEMSGDMSGDVTKSVSGELDGDNCDVLETQRRHDETQSNEFQEDSDQHVTLSKRTHARYQADHRDATHVRWGSRIQAPGKCTSGFRVWNLRANFIQWWVRGRKCSFVLYKNPDCKGKKTFDTREFNVVSDGSRYNVGFSSVFFRCR